MMQRKFVRCKRQLAVTELFNIAVKDFGAMLHVRCNRIRLKRDPMYIRLAY